MLMNHFYCWLSSTQVYILFGWLAIIDDEEESTTSMNKYICFPAV